MAIHYIHGKPFCIRGFYRRRISSFKTQMIRGNNGREQIMYFIGVGEIVENQI